MAKIVEHEQMRQQLIEGVIKTVAKFGLEGLTTRKISQECNLNEAYIYRYFIDVNDLLTKAYIKSDTNLTLKVCECASILKDESKPRDQRIEEFFNEAWDYMTEDMIYCLFYTRYYKSTLYSAEAKESHRKNCDMLKEKVFFNFNEDMDLDFIMHFTFNTILFYIFEISKDFYKDSKELRHQVLLIIYDATRRYFVK